MKLKEPIAKLKKNEQSMSGRNAKSKKKSVKKCAKGAKCKRAVKAGQLKLF